MSSRNSVVFSNSSSRDDSDSGAIPLSEYKRSSLRPASYHSSFSLPAPSVYGLKSTPSSRPTSRQYDSNRTSMRATPLNGGLERRMSTPAQVAERKNAVMTKFLYAKLAANMWFSNAPAEGSINSDPFVNIGVLLRFKRGEYTAQPTNLSPVLIEALKIMNVEVAFTMVTDTTDTMFRMLDEGNMEHVLFSDGSQYQVVDSLADIASGDAGHIKKLQYTCLIRQERIVLVWHDSIEDIVDHAQEVERKLLELIWGSAVPNLFAPLEDCSGTATPIEKSRQSGYFKAGDIKVETTEMEDPENYVPPKESLDRPLLFTSAIIAGLAVALMTVLLYGIALSVLLQESLVDHRWYRLALMAIAPLFALLGLFFAATIFGSLFQMFGPITGTVTNSRYYSAIKPDIGMAVRHGFTPEHITIQMPVYKESLESTIKPTIVSLKTAISHYEMKGGSASIFVNDDGMQLIPEEEAIERANFYHDNNIGWVSRPRHGHEGFVRAGKFKKASNMNFALNISNKTEDTMRELIDQRINEKGSNELTTAEAEYLYNEALSKVLTNDRRARAAGNIRIGRYILIVDSDTRVPEDCLMNAAAELFLNPEVAIIQHNAGVMQVVGDYFENGITFFTNLIYSAIRFSTGSGEVAPFVGHNAFLRWEAIQSVARRQSDGYDAFWSESHVSEDFDMALRLQVKGYIIRLASYHAGDFQEGVSLTVYDELSRWEKYAFGCNELCFNPIWTWLWRGPFSQIFRKFLWTDIQLSCKINTIGYIVTYYAMASSLPLTLMNYFLVGWFISDLDHFYFQSWQTFLAVLVVFPGLGNLALAMLRYRLGERSFIGALLENLKWTPMFSIFFGGVSFHLCCALCAHALGIDMEWGATAKEAEKSNFWKEIPKIFSRFKWMYMCVGLSTVGVIYLGAFAPSGWRITNLTALVPLCVNLGSHLLLPFVLNPALMIFTY